MTNPNIQPKIDSQILSSLKSAVNVKSRPTVVAKQ